MCARTISHTCKCARVGMRLRILLCVCVYMRMCAQVSVHACLLPACLSHFVGNVLLCMLRTYWPHVTVRHVCRLDLLD